MAMSRRAVMLTACASSCALALQCIAPLGVYAQQAEVPASDFEEDGGVSEMQSASPPSTPAGAAPTAQDTTPSAEEGWRTGDDAPQVSADWRTYTDPTGSFSLQVPAGWNVATDRGTGRIDVGVIGGPDMSILPFFIAGKSLDSAQAALFFNLLMKQSAPNATWSAPSAVGQNAIKANYTTNSDAGSAAMAYVSGTPGTIGRVFLSRVPYSATAIPADTFGRIMGSLKFAAAPPVALQQSGGAGDYSGDSQGGGSGEQGFGNVTYQKFVDPNQNAFYIDVPVGWKVSGGMVRPIAIDARPWVKVVSPDDLCTIFLGDPAIAPATIPTPLMYKLGFREGSNYNTGYGLRTVVLNYQPASKFVQKYGNMVLKRFARDIAVERVEDHPDIARARNGDAQMSSAASAKFTGMYGSTPMVAYFLASTKGQWVSGVGGWWVTLLGGVVTTPGRDQAAIDIFCHMLRSFEYNPQWTGNAIAAAGETSRIVSATNNAISKSISDSYWNRQRVQDRAANNFSNYIRGTQDLQDPTTGTVYNVEYGPKYHWINSGGNILSTDSSEIPGVDWTQMTAPPAR